MGGICSKRYAGAVHPETVTCENPGKDAPWIAHAPTVGPIVGITDNVKENSIRLWGRGSFSNTSGEVLACSAACCCIRRDGTSVMAWDKGPITVQPMSRENDWTGVVDLQVPADFVYMNRMVKYAFGVIYHKPGATIDPLKIQFQDDRFYVTQLLPSSDHDEAIHILFGSCKYMFKKNDEWFEWLFPCASFDDAADFLFGHMARLSMQRPYSLLVLGGDQIYIDDLADMYNKADDLQAYYAAYRISFNTIQHKTLMTKIPTMMTWDDHEIWNNFAVDELDKDEEKRQRYALAQQAYKAYQKSHSPAAGLKRNWYPLPLGKSATIFCADNRSDRRNDTKVVFGSEQLDAIKSWLKGASASAIKILLVTVPMAPDFDGVDLRGKIEGAMDEAKIMMLKALEKNDQHFGNQSTDRWCCYADQRKEILAFIRDNNIRRVVLMSGDLHCAYSCTLVCPTDPAFKVVQLVSSAFYPVLGLDQATQGHDTMVPNPLVRFDDGAIIDVEGMSPIYNKSNFGSIEIGKDGNSLTFELYGNDGGLLSDQVRRWTW